MKISLAQINFIIGNFETNTQKIVQAIAKAKEENVDIIVFPELAVCGYPPRDFLKFDNFIEKCVQAIEQIAISCIDIAAIIGSPSKNTSSKGKNLFNSAYFLSEGEVKEIRHKTLLPTYDIFDEYRYFQPNDTFNLIEYKKYKFAITICEDLWNVNKHPKYKINPMEEFKQKPDFIINIAASPFHYKQDEIRKKILAINAQKYNIPIFYVNHVGAQSELIFDGGSLVISSTGKIAGELNYFKEDQQNFDLKKIKEEKNSTLKNNTSKINKIHKALIVGVQDYFNKLNLKKAILGLSGGIDSAVTLAIAAEALGNKNVRAVMLPSKFSSDHSISDSKKMVQIINCENDIISIENVFNSFEKTMLPIFKELPFNVAEENIQARARAVILMAISNKLGYILLNTSNKSETAVGYGTLYGDMCGGLSVIGDVYKTEVFELAEYINRSKEIIPENIIKKPPSAELRPNQLDSDSLPDYKILDKILYKYIEENLDSQKIIALGFAEKTVKKVLKMVNMNEWKRYQTSPILRVSPKAFGIGRRMPIVAKYTF